MDSNHLVNSKKDYIIFTDCKANASSPQVLTNNFKDCVGRIITCKCNEFLGFQIVSAPKGFDDELSMFCIPLNKLQIYQFNVGYVNKLTMLVPKKKIENDTILIKNPDASIWTAKLNKMAIPTQLVTIENPRKYKKIEAQKPKEVITNASHAIASKPSIFTSQKPSIFSPSKPHLPENKLPFPMNTKPIPSNNDQLSNLQSFRKDKAGLNLAASEKPAISFADLKNSQRASQPEQIVSPLTRPVIDLSSDLRPKFNSFKSKMPEVIDLTEDSPDKDKDVFSSFKSKF